MKIIIAYPPLDTEKGTPLLGQNRQFQYFKEPTYIYPVVPAQAATLLQERGFTVRWCDGIAQQWTPEHFFSVMRQESPDVIAMETKTPVVALHWRIIERLKNDAAAAGRAVFIVLFGDHVTALPQESLDHSRVDAVLTGGDYDFLLANLCAALVPAASGGLVPAREPLEPGIWYRENGQIRHTGPFALDHDLNTLPFIDRDLTQWRLYAYKNGNFRRTPGTYIMSGRDCWWGKCTFCSWPQLYPRFRCRTPEQMLDEVAFLVERYQIREIMDDSGSFPVGEWLRHFCNGMISRGLHRRVTLDCNMRFGALSAADYKLMRAAGFRFLLFGIESANQATLERIKKNLDVETIKQSCQAARAAGLYPHITIMFGYPWETLADAQRTLALGKWLLRKDYAYTMQSTVVIPYPGTPLYEECRENGWLKSSTWSDYDMKQPVMTIPFPEEVLMQLVRSLYSVSYSPEFLFRKLMGIRDWDDIRYYSRAFMKVAGHIIDFNRSASRGRATAVR